MKNKLEDSLNNFEQSTSAELYAIFLEAQKASEEGQTLEDVQNLVITMREHLDASNTQLSSDIIDTLRNIKNGKLDLESSLNAMAEIAILIANRDGFAKSKENFLQSK